MQNIYYVYAYIRSKDSETAKSGTPYYIGKGKYKRAWQSHRYVKIPENTSNIVIIARNLTELGAFALERRLICWYGRKDIGTGILINRTDGGEGTTNMSLATRQKISEAGKGRTPPNKGKKSLRPAWNKGLTGTRLGTKCSEETKEKMRLAAKKRVEKYGPPTTGFKPGNQHWVAREQNRKGIKLKNNIDGFEG